jgi:hypothetical protein
LCPLQACEGDVLAEIAQDFAVKKVTLRWVSNPLDSNQITARVALSLELLEDLTNQKRNDFDHAIIGDESRFYFKYPHAAV